MPTTATPNLLTDPGYLFWAPLGTAEPTNTVTGSKFTDTWPVAWLSLGATEEGSRFRYEINTDTITVAEFFDPIRIVTTGRGGSFAMALTDFTMQNLKRAMNGAASNIVTVSGTGATTLTSLVPPEPSEIIRCMLGWEALDATLRLICYQTLNGGAIEAAFRKGTEKATIPCEFQFEVPTAAPQKPFKLYSAGTTRVGT